jgi:hypothetical protein
MLPGRRVYDLPRERISQQPEKRVYIVTAISPYNKDTDQPSVLRQITASRKAAASQKGDCTYVAYAIYTLVGIFMFIRHLIVERKE